MVNLIWLGLLVVSVVVAAFTGKIEVITKAAFSSAEGAVQISLGLIGIMCFWLGIMEIAREAGLVNMVGRLFRPVARILFPSVPSTHPALGAIVMNLSATMLGLGNAATPMGLIAMKELQEINEQEKDTASDAMITFLVLNTTCITLIPTTVIALRTQAGSLNPTEIVGTTFLATLGGTVIGIIADRILRRWYRGRNRHV